MSVWKQGLQPTETWKSPSVQLYSFDALELLQAMADRVADIVFLDPPFNLGKRYGSRRPREDRLSSDSYYRYLSETLVESVRVLRPGG